MKKSIILFLLAINSVLFAHEWNPYEINTDKNLNDVFFLSENLGWIVGDDGVIFKLENEQWVQIEQDITSENLNSVFFVNDSIGWVVGNNGIILKYENEQFTLFDSPTDQHLNGVCFVGENFGWITGDGRTILEFTEVGWQKYSTDHFSYDLGDLKQIQFIDATFGAIIGGDLDGGFTILTYSNGEWVEDNNGTNTTYLNGLFVMSPDVIFTVESQNVTSFWGQYIKYNSTSGSFSTISTTFTNNSTCDIDISDNIGWSVYNRNIYIYENGEFAKIFNEPVSSEYLNAIDLINDSTGWAVGNAGTLLKYNYNGNIIKATNTPYAYDDGNTNSSEDIKVSVNSLINTDYISEFRAFVFPYSDTLTTNAIYACSLSDDHYTNISPNFSDTIVQLKKNQVDYYGNPITNDIIYSVKILSVPDSINSFIPVFSDYSRIFKLENNKSFYAGQKEGFGVHWYECDTLFCSSSYIYHPSEDLNNEIDLNRDGIMDFNVYGYEHFGSGAGWMKEYLFTGLNENNKVMTTYFKNKEDWLDVLNEDYPINDIYNWYSEDGLLYELMWSNSSGFYPGDRIYYLAFSIVKDGITQYAWLKLKGLEYIEYGYFDNHTGINENVNNDLFEIYPNPASNSIKIHSYNIISSSQNIYISVYNMMGVKVDEFRINDLIQEKELSHYSNGIYLFEINQNGQTLETHKILIE
jgi:photosystem II stability/assembly factor-like uncharacterized protein